MQFSTSFSLPSSALISSFFSAVRSQFLPPSFRICEFLPNLHRKFLIYDQRTWCRQLGKNCFLNFFLYHYLSACDCMIGKVIRQTINFARSMHYLTCYNVKGSLVILLSLWWMKKKAVQGEFDCHHARKKRGRAAALAGRTFLVQNT